MNESTTVISLDFARFARLEQRIGESEETGLFARWEFGRELLAARDGKGRLPNGYLTKVAAETGAGRRELKYRAQFATRFATPDELGNAVAQFRSWHAIVRDALPQRGDAEAQGVLRDLPDGEFRVIVADPPWQYGNTSTRGAAEDHYATMTIAELCELEVEDRAADQSHLYLWTTNGFLREAFEVMDAWGFTYKTTLVWVKPQMGMGNYFRSSTEYVLFGIRGGLRTQARDMVNWFNAPRAQHSRKPDCFYDLVEKASAGPYLEMFSRRRRLGWEGWGHEA